MNASKSKVFVLNFVVFFIRKGFLNHHNLIVLEDVYGAAS